VNEIHRSCVLPVAFATRKARSERWFWQSFRASGYRWSAACAASLLARTRWSAHHSRAPWLASVRSTCAGIASGQDGNSDTKERVPRDALFLFRRSVAGPGRIQRWSSLRRAAVDRPRGPWKAWPPPHLPRVPVRRALFAPGLGTRRGRLL